MRVLARVSNPTNTELTDTIRLYDSSDRQLDTSNVTVGATDDEYVSLEYDTFETQRDVTFPITVRSQGDSDSKEVTVNEVGTAYSLTVQFVETPQPVTGGEEMRVDLSLGNGAPVDVTNTVELVDSSGGVVAQQEETLARESTSFASLTWETYPVRNDSTFPLTARTLDDSDTREVTVYGTG